jgi:GMP synthase-like glutamine amidotransferase
LLLVEQEPLAPAGHVVDWLARRGLAHRVVTASAGEPLPDFRRFGAVIALGSQRSAYHDHVPWVRRELDELHRAVDSGVPVLGICFGAQALARSLGATVAPAPSAEIGWLDIGSHRSDLVADGPWFTWHSDQFSLPEGATLLARNHHSIQAFGHGPHLGLQFHPEVTPDVVGGWLALAERQGVIAHDDAVRDLRRTRELYRAARAQAMAVFDAWYDGDIGAADSSPIAPTG